MSGAGSPESPSPVEFPLDLSLMGCGNWVWIRYGSTQHDSTRGDRWRRVRVIRPGHVSETEYGRPSDSDSGDGWWVIDGLVRKFFLKKRIISVKLHM